MKIFGKGLYVRDPVAKKPTETTQLLTACGMNFAIVNAAHPTTALVTEKQGFPTLVCLLPEKFDDGLGSIAVDEWIGSVDRIERVRAQAKAAGSVWNLEKNWGKATVKELNALGDAAIDHTRAGRDIVIVSHNGLRGVFARIAARCSAEGVIVSPECYDHQIAGGGYRALIDKRIADWTRAGWRRDRMMLSVASIPAPHEHNDPTKFRAYYEAINGVGLPAAVWPVFTPTGASRAVLKKWQP